MNKRREVVGAITEKLLTNDQGRINPEESGSERRMAESIIRLLEREGLIFQEGLKEIHYKMSDEEVRKRQELNRRFHKDDLNRKIFDRMCGSGQLVGD